MALLIKAEELSGIIPLEEAIAAVEQGFRDQGEMPSFSLPRLRTLYQDRRLTLHPGGYHRLKVAGVFVHYERFSYTKEVQHYAGAGKRVYVAYDRETAEPLTVIVGSLPLFEFDSSQDMFATETALTSAVGTKYLARRDARVHARRLLGPTTPAASVEEVKKALKDASEEVEHYAAYMEVLNWLLDGQPCRVKE